MSTGSISDRVKPNLLVWLAPVWLSVIVGLLAFVGVTRDHRVEQVQRIVQGIALPEVVSLNEALADKNGGVIKLNIYTQGTGFMTVAFSRMHSGALGFQTSQAIRLFGDDINISVDHHVLPGDHVEVTFTKRH